MDFLSILEKSRLFSGMEQGEISAMLSCLGARRGEFHRGQEVLGGDGAPREMGLVLTGCVHIQQEDFWGNRNILTDAEPGDVFAESYACFPEAPMAVRAVAAEPSGVLFLKAGRILNACPTACRYHTRLIRNLLETVAAQNLLMQQKLLHLTQRSIRGRLLSYLSAEAARQGSAAFTIPYDRQQLADYLSVDRSALSAELSRLQKEGILIYRKNAFELKRTMEQ